MNSVTVVDGMVKEVESLLSDYYGDEQTAFVFTSDHGMSPIGNHGDGGEVFIVLQNTLYLILCDTQTLTIPGPRSLPGDPACEDLPQTLRLRLMIHKIGRAHV